MARHRLKHYQDTYAQAMSKYGLQRGVDGSLARHISTMQYYKAGRAAGQPAENIENLLGLEEEAQKKLKQVKGGNQRAENEGGGGERHHSHSGRGELTFRRQQGQEAGSGE